MDNVAVTGKLVKCVAPEHLQAHLKDLEGALSSLQIESLEARAAKEGVDALAIQEVTSKKGAAVRKGGLIALLLAHERAVNSAAAARETDFDSSANPLNDSADTNCSHHDAG